MKYLLFLFLFAVSVSASPISKIKVRGNQRLEQDTILMYLPFKVGDDVSDNMINTGIKDLYKTGLFEDIQIKKDNNQVIVSVVERPVIGKIEFVGNDKISTDILSGEIQSKVLDVYSKVLLNRDVERLEQIYQRQGLTSASIKTEVKEKKGHRMELTFIIDEGNKNYIEKITFKGNKIQSSADLKEAMMTKEKKWYRFLSQMDTFDPDRLTYDKELLRRYYLNRGYIDFKINDVKISQDAKSKNTDITFDLFEGERYSYGQIDLKTTIKDVDSDYLKGKIFIQKGQFYSASNIDKVIDILTEEMGRKGYAFVNVEPIFNQNEKNKTVDVVFNVSTGKKVFINEIDITGNVRTLDKVIRRQMRLVEGDPFNPDKLRRSKNRVENLDYFSKVDLKTKPVLGQSDKIDVLMDVVEKSTGAFNIGVGYSTYDGLLFEVNIQEKNFLGSGNMVGVRASTSDNENQVDLSFTNPYFMDKPISAGFDLFAIKSDYDDYVDYDERSVGGALRSGWDYTETLRQTVKYSLQQNKIENVDEGSSIYIKEQEGTSVLSMIGSVLSYNTLDNNIIPTQGLYSSVGLDLAGIGGDQKFARINLDVRQYFSLTDKIIFSVRGGAGYIVGLGEDIRIDNRYYLGGRSLRGFETAGIGARTQNTDDVLGGDWRVTAGAELTFPLGLPNEFGVSGKLFVDAGILGKPNDVKEEPTDPILYSSKPRVSIGTGVLWRSPMGPISIDLAYPIVKEDYDKDQVFNLNFGTSF